MPVLAAMGHREPRRVAKAVRRAMHDFGDHGKRANSACANARNEQELREIGRTAFGGGRQVAVQAPGDDIFCHQRVLCGTTRFDPSDTCRSAKETGAFCFLSPLSHGGPRVRIPLPPAGSLSFHGRGPNGFGGLRFAD